MNFRTFALYRTLVALACAKGVLGTVVIDEAVTTTLAPVYTTISIESCANNACTKTASTAIVSYYTTTVNGDQKVHTTYCDWDDYFKSPATETTIATMETKTFDCTTLAKTYVHSATDCTTTDKESRNGGKGTTDCTSFTRRGKTYTGFTIATGDLKETDYFTATQSRSTSTECTTKAITTDCASTGVGLHTKGTNTEDYTGFEPTVEVENTSTSLEDSKTAEIEQKTGSNQWEATGWDIPFPETATETRATAPSVSTETTTSCESSDFLTITVTSCKGMYCQTTATPVSISLVTFTTQGVETVYTTYCPLTESESEIETTTASTLRKTFDMKPSTSSGKTPVETASTNPRPIGISTHLGTDITPKRTSTVETPTSVHSRTRNSKSSATSNHSERVTTGSDIVSITVTSCHGKSCQTSTTPVSISLVTVTSQGTETVYTTYCPLTSTETDSSSSESTDSTEIPTTDSVTPLSSAPKNVGITTNSSPSPKLASLPNTHGPLTATSTNTGLVKSTPETSEGNAPTTSSSSTKIISSSTTIPESITSSASPKSSLDTSSTSEVATVSESKTKRTKLKISSASIYSAPTTAIPESEPVPPPSAIPPASTEDIETVPHASYISSRTAIFPTITNYRTSSISVATVNTVSCSGNECVETASIESISNSSTRDQKTTQVPSMSSTFTREDSNVSSSSDTTEQIVDSITETRGSTSSTGTSLTVVTTTFKGTVMTYTTYCPETENTAPGAQPAVSSTTHENGGAVAATSTAATGKVSQNSAAPESLAPLTPKPEDKTTDNVAVSRSGSPTVVTASPSQTENAYLTTNAQSEDTESSGAAKAPTLAPAGPSGPSGPADAEQTTYEYVTATVSIPGGATRSASGAAVSTHGISSEYSGKAGHYHATISSVFGLAVVLLSSLY